MSTFYVFFKDLFPNSGPKSLSSTLNKLSFISNKNEKKILYWILFSKHIT